MSIANSTECPRVNLLADDDTWTAIAITRNISFAQSDYILVTFTAPAVFKELLNEF